MSKNKLSLFVKDGCLYAEDADGVDQVTHVQRIDGGGIDVHQVHVTEDEVWALHRPRQTFLYASYRA